MTTHKSSPQKRGKKQDDSKQLRKQEKNLQERLQKAQEKHAKAQELLERAQARVQKRAAQMQRLKDRLAQIHAQAEVAREAALPAPALQVTAPEELPLSSSFTENMPDTSFVTIIPPLSAQSAENAPATEISPASSESQPSTETVPSAWQARAVAEATEEEVRATVGRVGEASRRLEEVESVEEIAEEEDQLEMGVTKTLAEAAAQAAAEAEALAEASSARTRKARIMARQADQELTLIRASIRNGSLTGKEAEAALQAAEDKSTRAHAELADAEAAEEKAVDAARDAEADAEVAEGMAVSAADRFVDDIDSINDVNGQVVQAIAFKEEGQEAMSTQPDDENEDDERTEEHPVIRPQGSA